METFVFDVIYRATVTDVVVVDAETEEEAIEKIKNGQEEDTIDNYIEKEDLIEIRKC